MHKPEHIAIVMDGNGRWAQERNLPRTAGHSAGAKSIKEVIRGCVQHHIPVLTLFAFGQENWRRPKDEVSFLMNLYISTMQDNIEELLQQNIKLRFIGDREALSSRMQKLMQDGEQSSAENTGLQLNIAINYSGRWDIVEACKNVMQDVAEGKIKAEEVSEALFDHHTMLSDLPAPDLFIRTSGEHRISNFLLWQLSYTELYFADEYWPDFDLPALEKALDAYAKRERRFGAVREHDYA
jgi:undecaprenyl diphosphate synthase